MLFSQQFLRQVSFSLELVGLSRLAGEKTLVPLVALCFDYIYTVAKFGYSYTLLARLFTQALRI